MPTDTAIEPIDVRPAPIHTDLRSAIVRADERRQQLAQAGDWKALAIGRDEVKTLIADLRVLDKATEADIARLMPERKITIDGLGTLERHGGWNRKDWDWDRLLPALIRRTLDPDGTGELPAAPEVVEAMKALIVEVIGVTGSKGPRLEPLRELGFDDDEWCQRTEKPKTVQLHKGDSK